MANLPCPTELWPVFSELLDRALDLPEADRAAWLASLGPEHAAVRPWLAMMLAESGVGGPPTDQFLQRHNLRLEIRSEFTQGQRIGPYVLERELGHGGMGEVWLASRFDGALNRRVALKLPYAYVMAGVLRQRFERERNILASLSHPNIAQLYDAGISECGHPYLAMELIDGVPITQHCRDHSLTLAARLHLFRQVLDAVDHAHAQFIAHRDIKPSNILVTRDGRIKLLDFGIAKLLDGNRTGAATELTQLGGQFVTPDYAAPEQLAGAPITTAVDLYALGVVLFELLTGRRPHESVHGKRLQHGQTPRASIRVALDHARSVGGVDVKALRRALGGDLDAILAKALETDPALRYRSAASFSEDIECSQSHRPISARHISYFTLVAKFVRRHRIGVSLAASLVLALLGGSVGIAWQAVRAEHQAQLAQHQAQRATAIKDFLVGVFRASDPRIASDRPRGTITAKELLDASSGQIEKQFAQDPETQIELLGVTADIYRALDESKLSAVLQRRQTDLARQRYGDLNPLAIEGLLGEAEDADANGDDMTALKLLDHVDELIHRAGLDRSATRARWWLQRGEALMSDTSSSQAMLHALQQSAQLYSEIAPRDPRYAFALNDLGAVFLMRSSYPESVRYYLQAIDVARQVTPRDDDTLTKANRGLAIALQRQGRFDEALQAYDAARTIALRTTGPNSRNYWSAAADYADLLHLRGRRQAALDIFQSVIDSQPKSATEYRNPTERFEAARDVWVAYGTCLVREGRAGDAIKLLEAARNVYQDSEPDDIDIARISLALATAYDLAGRHSDAEREFSENHQALERLHMPRERTANLLLAQGQSLLKRGDLRNAKNKFEQSLNLVDGDHSQSVALAYGGLAQIALARNDAKTAVAMSRLALQIFDGISGVYDVRTGPLLWQIEAETLLLSGDADGARLWAQRAVSAYHQYDGPRSTGTLLAEATLHKTSQMSQVVAQF